jgi:nitroreductase
MTMDLYEAILARRSVRRFERRVLDAEGQALVKAVVAAVQPLVDENRFEVLYHDVAPGEDLVRALGAYGRIVTPPHYLVPFVLPKPGFPQSALELTDLGFRVQQIAVRLVQAGIGSCYVGCLPHEDAARAYFDLAEGARIGASLIYGYAGSGRRDQLVNSTMRRAIGATRKLPPERLFFDGAFDRASVPPPELALLIDAARAAPSAANAQPWRFLWHEGQLYLYLKRQSWRYGLGRTQDYRWYDGGICMGNVALASEALGLEGRWSLVAELNESAPACPDELEPLAVLRLSKV